MRHLALAATLILVISSQALAWSAAGHKFVASIAFARLTPADRVKVIEILSEHPRFQQDFFEKLSEVTDDSAKAEWYFQEAAVWPDVARGFRGNESRYNHGTWHYINLPHFLNESDSDALNGKLDINVSLIPPEKPIEQMNAIQTLRLARKILSDKSTSSQDKAIMLAWLFHLVGDIHQPLHSSALFSQKLFHDGDRGGNRVLTVQHKNLHSLCDSLPGGEANLRKAQIADADLAKLGEAAAAELDEETWLNESRDLAVSFVYSPDLMGYLRNIEQEGGNDLKPFDFDTEYLRAGGKICDKRLIQAGYRLAAALKQTTK